MFEFCAYIIWWMRAHHLTVHLTREYTHAEHAHKTSRYMRSYSSECRRRRRHSRRDVATSTGGSLVFYFADVDVVFSPERTLQCMLSWCTPCCSRSSIHPRDECRESCARSRPSRWRLLAHVHYTLLLYVIVHVLRYILRRCARRTHTASSKPLRECLRPECCRNVSAS